MFSFKSNKATTVQEVYERSVRELEEIQLANALAVEEKDEIIKQLQETRSQHQEEVVRATKVINSFKNLFGVE